MRRLCVLLVLCGFATGQEPKRWYKGNTHTHSFWSDGNDFPEMIVDWYRKRDYHFLALSDHNILSEGERWLAFDRVAFRAPGKDVLGKYRQRFGDEWVETREKDGKSQVRLKTLAEFRPIFEKPGEFLLIQAEEITDRFARQQVHINAINLERLIRPQHGKSVRETMRNNLRKVIEQEKATGEPILAHLNHPNFQWSLTAEDLAHVLEEDFFEVYNGHPGVHQQGDRYRPGDEGLWDVANTIRLGQLQAPPLYGVATDDSHHYHGGSVSPGRGWIMVRASRLAARDLIQAMRAGEFYGSTGVTLKDVRYDRATRRLTLEIEPDGEATFTTRFIGTPAGYDPATRPTVDDTGKEIATTRVYSPDVGKVFETVNGTRASYQLTGQELYVRAMITSSAAAANPSYKGQKKQAWTQPVGWERRVKNPGPTRLRIVRNPK